MVGFPLSCEFFWCLHKPLDFQQATHFWQHWSYHWWPTTRQGDLKKSVERMVCLVGSGGASGNGANQKKTHGKRKAERIFQKIASYETKLVNETNEIPWNTKNASKVLKQWDTIHGLLCNSPLPPFPHNVKSSTSNVVNSDFIPAAVP